MAAQTSGQEQGTPKPRRRRRIGCIVAPIVVVAAAAGAGGIGWTMLEREHQEARSVTLDAADFTRLKDGAYHGVYAGGMYKWRTNECDVTVAGGKVTDIALVASQNLAAETANAEMLYDRVIQAQSLQVDTISGATLTGKAYLKAVEDALVQSQR
ncbi:MAG: FMN-binding protein [Chloroflexi bacterium]|nr:FMN-binding protein [Chloroflexota bacterium]